MLYLYLSGCVVTAEVDKHLSNEQTRAAVKIQSVWKGYREKKGLEKRKSQFDRIRAAIKIQRKVESLFTRDSSIAPPIAELIKTKHFIELPMLMPDVAS